MDSKTLQTLRCDAEDICRSAIEASVPDAAIQRALAQLPPCQGRTVLPGMNDSHEHLLDFGQTLFERDTLLCHCAETLIELLFLIFIAALLFFTLAALLFDRIHTVFIMLVRHLCRMNLFF